MAQEGTARHAAYLDRAMMAGQGRGTLTASEREAVSGSSAASLSGIIYPAGIASTYEGVRVPDHIADALNRMARR